MVQREVICEVGFNRAIPLLIKQLPLFTSSDNPYYLILFSTT